MNPRRDWLAGLTVGAWAGFSLVYFSIIGLALLLGFAGGAALGRSWAAGGGLLLAAGAVILLMLGLATSRCDAGCSPPDLTGFVVAGSAMALIGAVLTVQAVAAPRPP